MRTQIAIGAIAGISAIAGAQTLNIGTFEGDWNNTTFGSTGASSMLVEDLGGGDFAITIDLDGFVFGGPDPDPIFLAGSVVGDVFTVTPFSDPTFGDVSGGIDALGAASFDMVGAGGGAFSLVTLRGTAVGDVIDLDYEIFTPAAGIPFAVGTVHMDRIVPSPGGMALFGIGGLMVTRRKR